jgi:membrane protein required for colicin V production
MTLIDYIIIGIVGISAFLGMLRGIIREIISLLIWLSAFWITWRYFRHLAEYLPYWISSPSIRYGISATILFLSTLSLGGIIGILFGILMDKSGLSTIDQLLGTVFGFIRGVAIIMILVGISGLTPFPKDQWWQNSRLLAPIQSITYWLLELLPYDLARYLRR